jgi:hypothetical protein
MRLARLFFGTAVLGLASGLARADTADWSTFYEHEQRDGLFSIRGLALARDGSGDVYYAHIQNALDGPALPEDDAVNIVRLDPSGAVVASIAVGSYDPHNPWPPGDPQPKAIACDDRGYLYAVLGDHIRIFDADLAGEVASVAVEGSLHLEGVTVQEVGGVYYVFVSDRSDGMIRRYDVTDPTRPTLTSWRFPLEAAVSARGVAVDRAGRVWIADKDGDQVFRVSADARTVTAVPLATPLDVAFFGPVACVSRQDGAASSVEVLDLETLAVVETLSPPSLGEGSYGLGGIDVTPAGMLFVADEDAAQVETPTGTACFDRILRYPLSLLALEPAPADFGYVRVGRSEVRAVRATNVGSRPVTIEAIAVSGAAFRAEGAALPIVLGPGESADLLVRFAPARHGAHTGAVEVTADDFPFPHRAALGGVGVNIAGEPAPEPRFREVGGPSGCAARPAAEDGAAGLVPAAAGLLAFGLARRRRRGGARR